MEDLQSWYEVPSIAHFCSLFRVAFNLIDFDIEELEEALLTDGVEDMGSTLLQELVVRLLKGCIGNEVTNSNYQMYLRRLFRKKCQERDQPNPFDSDLDFQFLPLRTKVEILHNLCDYRLDSDDVMEVLKNLEADSLRVEPLGYDDTKAAYWYFYGTRLYKEENALTSEEHLEDLNFLKKKVKKKQTDTKRRWKVICFTEDDWRKLCDSFASSTSKEEKSLYRTLVEDFLPEIPNLFAEKERQQKKRMEERTPRRASARIEKLKEQRVEQDRVVAEALQAEFDSFGTERPKRNKKIDEDEWQSLRNKADRATRALLREISRDNGDLFSSVDSSRSRAGSVDSSVSDNPDSKNATADKKTDKDRPKESTKEKMRKTGTKKKNKKKSTGASQPSKRGRQTNNSLSSVLDTQHVAFENQPPATKKKKPRPPSSLVDLVAGMSKVMEHVKNHPDAWPFLDPVDEDFAPDYYTKIVQPMDLEKMESRISSNYYGSVEEFVSDFMLIVDNCKNYNGEDSEYSSMVDSLSEEFHKLVSRFLDFESSGSELSDSGSESCGSLTDHRRPTKKSRSHGEMVKLVRAVNGSSESTKQGHSKVKLKTEDVWDTPDSSDAESGHKRGKNKVKVEEKSKKKLKKKKKLVHSDRKHLSAINALDAATEKTLKDMNKWLDDTPKFSEYSSNSSSPKTVPPEEFKSITNSVEEEYRKNNAKKVTRKLKTTPTKKKGLIVLAARAKQQNAEVKEDKEVKDPVKKQRDPLGKEKGLRNSLERLGSNKPKLSKVTRPDESKLSSVIARIKESRYSALQKQTADLERKPQLSLGTVLCSDIELPVPKAESADEDMTDTKPDDSVAKKPKLDKEEPVTDKESEVKEVATPEPPSSNSATPNLSAWFKAFGAPKSQASKRKTSESEPVKLPAAKQEVAWYSRVAEKKESPTKNLTSLWTSTAVKKTEEEEKPAALVETSPATPASPADSLGSVNSPTPSSVESIRSPATPSGGWGGNRFPPGSAGEISAVQSPATPEPYQSPVPVVTAPIKVGFYQDMSQQLKGASPSNTNPNSPLQQPVGSSEPATPTSEGSPETGYPLKKRATPIAVPTPIVATPVIMSRDPPAAPNQYAPPPTPNQKPILPPYSAAAPPPMNSFTQQSTSAPLHSYGPGGSSSLPGNLASLSQIVARIPSASTNNISPSNVENSLPQQQQQQQVMRSAAPVGAIPASTAVTSLPGYQISSQSYQVSQSGPFYPQQQAQQQQQQLQYPRPSQQHYPATPSAYPSSQQAHAGNLSSVWGTPNSAGTSSSSSSSISSSSSSSSAVPSSVSSAQNSYRPSGNSAFAPSLGYDSMMSSSLLFSGLEHSLAGNSSMFARNPLSRSSPWASSLPLDPMGSTNEVAAGSATQQSRTAASATVAKNPNGSNRQAAIGAEDKSRTSSVDPSSASGVAAAANMSNLGFSYNTQSMPGAASSQGPAGGDSLLYGRNARVPSQPNPLPHAFLGGSHSANSRTAQGHVTIPPPAHQAYPSGPSGHPLTHPSFAVPGMHSSFLSSQTGHAHHPLDPTTSSTLYHQLLQHRQQQEELLLRSPHPHPSMVLHQSGLLGSPAAYPSGFTPGLGPLHQGWL